MRLTVFTIYVDLRERFRRFNDLPANKPVIVRETAPLITSLRALLACVGLLALVNLRCDCFGHGMKR